MFNSFSLMFKKLFSSKKWISLLILLIIPFAYIFFYVGAYENVDTNTKNFKVGVLILDQKYHNNNFGKIFEKNLHENKEVKFEFYTNENSVNEDLKKYDNIYEYIKIPKDFTYKIVNIKEKLMPSDLEFEIVQNPQKNGFSDTITQQLKSKIKSEFNHVFIKTIVDLANKKVPSLVDKKEQINAGLNKLVSGFEKLNSSLNDAQSTLKNKEKVLYDILNSYKNSKGYELLPNLTNNVTYLNSYLDELTSTTKQVSNQNQSNVISLLNKINFSNDNIVNSIISQIQTLDKLHNDFVKIISNQSLISANQLTAKKSIQKIISTIDLLNQDLAQRINKSILLNPTQKNTLLDINQSLNNYKQIFKNILLSGLKSIDDVNGINTNVLTYINTMHINNLFKFLNIDPSVVSKIENLLDVNKINSLVNVFNTDVSTIVSNSQHNLNKAKSIKTLVSEIFEKIDLINLNENPKSSINSLLHPITIQREDLNEKPKFGAIFYPLTLAIGLWFILIFYFTGSFKEKMYKSDFIAKYFFNLVITQVLAFLSALLAIYVAQVYQIKIYNNFMFILTCNVFIFSIFNLFILVYNYIFNYAKYILTIIMVINITASGSTYVVNTLNENFFVFNNLTHFKFFINTIRELIGTNTNYSLINSNLITLLLFSIVPLIVNILLKIISKKLSKKT